MELPKETVLSEAAENLLEGFDLLSTADFDFQDLLKCKNQILEPASNERGII